MRWASGDGWSCGAPSELGGGGEADPGPDGQVGDPFGPEHRRELAEHAWQAPGGHDRHPATTTLPEEKVWSPQSWGAFLDHVRDDRLYALWLLVATAGMRRGELAGPRWVDIDLDHGTGGPGPDGGRTRMG